jgi:hypothetical protein
LFFVGVTNVRFSFVGVTSPSENVSQLRRFLGMLSFYRRFFLHAEETQSPLHDAISGPRINGFHPITLTIELLKAFEE